MGKLRPATTDVKSEGKASMMNFTIIVNGRPYKVEIANPSQSPMSVIVEGETFQVEITGGLPRAEKVASSPAPKPAQAPPPRPVERRVEPPPVTVTRPAAPKAPAGAVTAPMPGKILGVKVKVGDRVKYGDALIVFEAMKMEQTIRAPGEGVVKATKVSEGQVVAYGDVLVEFE